MWGSGAAARGVLFAITLLAAPDAAALGPQVALGAPKGFVGRMTVSPKHGPAGTPVTLTAEGLPPGQEFQLVWGTVNGAWKVADAEYHGREFTPVGYEIAKARSDAAGRLTATFIAPEDYGFLHDIVLQQGDRLFTQVAFNLDMTIEISPKSGPPGTPIHVRREGHRLPLALQFLGRDLRQQFHRLDFGGHHARARRVSPFRRAAVPASTSSKCCMANSRCRTANPEQNPAPGRPRFELALHGHHGCAGAAAAARRAGPKESCGAAAAGRTRVATPQFSGVGEPARCAAKA